MEQITDLYNANTETIESLSPSIDQYSKVQEPVVAAVVEEYPQVEIIEPTQIETIASLTSIAIYEEPALQGESTLSVISDIRDSLRVMNKIMYAIAVSLAVGLIFGIIFAVRTDNRLKNIENMMENAQIHAKEVYKTSDNLEFTIELPQNPEEITQSIIGAVYAAQQNEYVDGVLTIRPQIVNTNNKEPIDMQMDITKASATTYKITGYPQNSLTPGEYTLKVELEGEGKVYVHEQNFNWGVLALNTNKSIYLPGDTANIQIAVLDNEGDMVCDANVTLEITDPLGNVTYRTTEDGSIITNHECHKKGFVWEPDYETTYSLGNNTGIYKMHLEAITANGKHEISDALEVKSSVPFDIERISATRIYPSERYPVIFSIQANENFSGTITEYIPRYFKSFLLNKEEAEVFSKKATPNFIENHKEQFIEELSEEDFYKTLTWNVNFEKGEVYTFGYWYDAPDKSPNFFNIGKLNIGNTIQEQRVWQIAVDYTVSLPHVEVFTDTDDTGANTTIDVYEDANNTTISHAAMIAAGFDDTSDVLIVADVNFDGNNANAIYSIRVADTAGTAVPNTTEIREPRTADDRNTIVRVVKKYTKTSGEGFVIQKAYHTAGLTAPRVQKGRMVIVGLDDLVNGVEYVYNENTTDTNVPANGSPADFASITTPADSQLWNGNVLVMDSWKVQADNGIGSDRIMHDLEQDDTTAVNETSNESEDNAEEMGDGTIYVFSQADTNAHTYKVRLENSDASTDSFDHIFSSIIAFPANLFEDFEYFNDDSEYDLSGTAFEEIGGITPFTPQNTGDFWILGSAIGTGAGSTNGDDTRIRVQVGGSTVPTGFNEGTEGAFFEDTSDQYPFNRSNIENFTTTSKDIDLDGASDFNTVDFYYRTLVALSFGLNTVNLSGTAYTDDNEVSTLNSYDVCVAVDKGFNPKDCDTTDGSGAFAIDDVFAATGSEQLTFFVDHATTHGNLITIGDGTNISGLELYQNHVKVEAESGDTISIINMDGYDNDENATDMLFDATDSSPDTLTWESGIELYVPSGYNFIPGGNTDGDDLQIVGTWTATGSETINLNGHFQLDSGGTFSPASSTLTFDDTSGTSNLQFDGTGSLYNLTIDDGGGGSLVVDLKHPLTITNNVSIVDGTLDAEEGAEGHDLTVGGNWDNDDTFEAETAKVIFSKNSGTATIDADGTGNDEFYDVEFDGNGTFQLTTDMSVGNDLSIIDGTLDSNASDIYLKGNWTNESVFSENTNTVFFTSGKNASISTDCATPSTCTDGNFYNITINKGLGGDIVTLISALRTTNTLTITSGEVIQNTYDVQLDGVGGTSLSLSDYGRYTNNSTGDITLGGNVVNTDGAITLNAGGGTCGDADDIVLSSTNTTARNWSGTGAFRIIDTDVNYMSGSAVITVANGTDGGTNGSNWNFVACNIINVDGLNIEGVNID